MSAINVFCSPFRRGAPRGAVVDRPCMESLGPLAPVFLVALALGALVQFAFGGALVLGRRVPAAAALAVPALLLALGGAGTGVMLAWSAAGILQSGDPAWVPWFALQDRARACVPGLVACLGAVVAVLPVVTATVVRALRGAQPARAPALIGAGVAVVVGAGVAADLGAASLVEGAALAVLVLAAHLACTDGAPAARGQALLGLGALVLGGLALSGAHALAPQTRLLTALPSFDHPFLSLPVIDAGLDGAAAQALGLLPWAVAACVLSLPTVVWRITQPGPRTDGTDALALVALVGAGAAAAAWAGVRADTLNRQAGAHAAAVLDEGGIPGVPLLEPVPARVLYVLPGGSHWLEMSEAGGSALRGEPLAMDASGPALHLGDGLVFPPRMTMDDVYFALDGADAGTVNLVGCTPAAGAWTDLARLDPLRAAGRCGAAPLALRVTDALTAPLTLIVLKDGLLDDQGDIVPVADLARHDPPTGRDVVLRAQLDATVSDLAAALAAVRSATRVYLGWGVSLDGSDLPIGVNPRRILRATPTPAEPAAPAASPVPAAVP